MVKYADRMEKMEGSAIRELLKLTAKPEIISFAGGMPAPELFPTEQMEQAANKVMGGIEYQNFNAVSAKVHIKGLDIHPGSAKDTMINAIEVAREFDEKIPQNERPVDTEGFEGFYHEKGLSH